MSKKNSGGPAFPVPGLQNDEDFNGMSLRDYFAAKAMATLILAGVSSDYIPAEAYKMADAMLAERAK